MMFNCIFQIFEWWYFKKYGTSFIEQVSLNHISPLLGGNDNPNQENNNTTPSSSSSSSSSSNSTHQQSMPGTVGYTTFEENSVLGLVCKCWSVCLSVRLSVRPTVCLSDCLSVKHVVVQKFSWKSCLKIFCWLCGWPLWTGQKFNGHYQ